MIKKFICFAGAIFVFGSCFAITSSRRKADVIGDLITDEQKKVEEWLSQEEELPPAYLIGEKFGVQIFADYMEGGDYEKLCGSLNLDELFGAAQGDPEAKVVPVDVGIERVREILGDSCLVRPRDILLAVGEGWYMLVTLKDFELRKTQPVCSFDNGYSLWSSFAETLPAAPLFFVSGINPSKGEENGYIAAGALTRSTVTAEDRSRLAGAVKIFNEYQVVGFEINATNCDRVYSLKKKVIKLDDVGIPSEILLWQKGDRIEVLEMEVVDKTEGSGHINLEGVMDFNNDGFVELWVSGDQKRCFYRLLFLGKELGFDTIKLPEKPCSC